MPRYKKDKESYEYGRSERVNWLDQFADNYAESQKTAVEVARERQELSLSDRINAIFNHTSATGHRTVEGVVQEYQERTGLNEYLQRVSNEQQQKKTAQIKTASIDVLGDFSEHIKEAVLNYVKNVIDNHHGHCTVPAVQYDVLSTFGHEGVKPTDILNDKFASVVSNLIAESLANNPQTSPNFNDLGKGVGVVDVDSDDADNSDFLSSITVNL